VVLAVGRCGESCPPPRRDVIIPIILIHHDSCMFFAARQGLAGLSVF
jgi:hypothetical protein